MSLKPGAARFPILLICMLAMSQVRLIGARLEAEPNQKGKVLYAFEDAAELESVKADSAHISLVSKTGAAGRGSLKIEIAPQGGSALHFVAGSKFWDWSDFGWLAMEMNNLSDEPVGVLLRMDDDPAADDTGHSSINGVLMGPKETVRYIFPVGAGTPMAKGMRGGPTIPGYEPPVFIAMKGINERHVSAFHLRFMPGLSSRVVLLSDIRLLPPASYDGIVDGFGQYTRADWPGKIKSERELRERQAAEEAGLKARPVLPGRDEFGGWAEGPQLEGTGFFSTTQRDGKWWLVTPSGHLFLSFGVNSIRLSAPETLVEGREKMFSELPAANNALSRHFGYTERILYGLIKRGKTFNFYSANLERKYGPNYLEKWRRTVIDRLRAWGFTTIANWSDPGLFDFKRLPYTATASIEGDFARLSSGIDYWGKMADPFDSQFALAARASLQKQAAPYRDDPWCLGFFVDNEISWGGIDNDQSHFGLVYGTLAGTAGSPAKQALVRQLRQKYGEIEKLNDSWKARLESWEWLLSHGYRPVGTLKAAAREDFSQFLKAFARQYFRTIKEALRQVDPRHLYLGCRFAWYTPEAVEASAEFCDVVSFNAYERRLEPARWDFVKALNKPCIIGEFHMGALDRGMFHTGLVAARNQKERAKMYGEYLHSIIDHPSFVGCGWFEYIDEPLTGRTYDGENYAIGLVSVTDTPYPEMTQASKDVYGEAYRRRAQK